MDFRFLFFFVFIVFGNISAEQSGTQQNYVTDEVITLAGTPITQKTIGQSNLAAIVRPKRQNVGTAGQPSSGVSPGYGYYGSAQPSYGGNPGYGYYGSAQPSYGVNPGYGNLGSVQPSYGINPGYGYYGSVQPSYGINPGYGYYGSGQPSYGVNPGYGNPGSAQPSYGINPGYGNFGSGQPSYGTFNSVAYPTSERSQDPNSQETSYHWSGPFHEKNLRISKNHIGFDWKIHFP